MTSRNAISAFIIAGIITAAPALSAQAAKPATTKVAPKVKEKEESQATLQKEAKVTLAVASATALKEVPGGKIKEHELEREDGKLIYSFDIKVAGKSGTEEVNIDAMTGAVVAKEHEDAAAEKKEKAEDAAKKAPVKKSGGGR
jgi:uncharacterized membrane protein YkoI